MKGIIFTVDGLLSLIAVMSLYLLFNSFQPSYVQSFNSMRLLGNDYLQLKYQYQTGMTPAIFNNLTGFNVNETQPSSNLSIHSVFYLYPNLCNCSGNCYLDISNDSCLSHQDANQTNSVYNAWVTIT
jgi:hypothetical protein